MSRHAAFSLQRAKYDNPLINCVKEISVLNLRVVYLYEWIYTKQHEDQIHSIIYDFIMYGLGAERQKTSILMLFKIKYNVCNY